MYSNWSFPEDTLKLALLHEKVYAQYQPSRDKWALSFSSFIELFFQDQVETSPLDPKEEQGAEFRIVHRELETIRYHTTCGRLKATNPALCEFSQNHRVVWLTKIVFFFQKSFGKKGHFAQVCNSKDNEDNISEDSESTAEVDCYFITPGSESEFSI